MKKLIAMGLILAMGCGMLVGCGNTDAGAGTEEASTTEVGTEETSADESGGEEVVITYISNQVPDSGDVNADATYAVIEKFLEDYPEVTIENLSIPSDELDVKIKAMIAANELPDVSYIRADAINQAANSGMIEPVNAMMDSVDGWYEKIRVDAYNDFLFDSTGDIYAVPGKLYGYAYMIYNTEMMEEIGYEEFPTTMEELMDAIDKLNANDIIPIAVGNKAWYPIASCFASTIIDRYTGNEWFTQVSPNPTGEANFTDPEFLQGLQVMSDLAEAEAFNGDINTIDEESGFRMVYNEQAAMTVTGSWGINAIDLNCPEDVYEKLKVANVPDVDGGVEGSAQLVAGGSSMGYVYNVEVKEDERKFELVQELIYRLTTDEYFEAGAEAKVSDMAAAEMPESFKVEEYPRLTQEYMALFNENQFGPGYLTVLQPELQPTYSTVLQEIVAGTMTPEDGAAKIQKDFETLILNK